MSICIRGHVQTIFGKINVINKGGWGVGGGVACDANFFNLCIAFFLLIISPDDCGNVSY